MPSFSSFLKRRDNSQIDEQDQENIVRHDGKVQRRHTKRDFLKSFLRRTSTRCDSSRQSAQLANPSTIVPSPNSLKTPTSPMSDPNKPLPAPPGPTTKPEPTPSPAKKLERIISPIALSDLHKLFSGAPQFFARSEGHNTGAPHPSVAFPWNEELHIRDLSDHQQIHNAAWSSISAWPHITRDVQNSAEATEAHHEKHRVHYLPRCRERPSMLSMQGLERGTMGFEAALEIGVADALQGTGENVIDGAADALDSRREEFLRDKDGLRLVSESILVERLIGASTAYQEDPQKHSRPTIELYTELFTQILFPPSRVTEHDDPYSLQVQIEVLIDVLGSPNIWFDFSLVEWRIRLGSILWGPLPEDDIVVNNEIEKDLGEHKYWLLLQILLASELLMRLDALSATIDNGRQEPNRRDVLQFDKKATSSVKWSLMLARCWLENIKIGKIAPEAVPQKKPDPGWLSRITGSSITINNEVDDSPTINSIQLVGMYQDRQLNGLIHFARKLNWPSFDSLSAKLSINGIKDIERSQDTPDGTPRSVPTQRASSYFSTRPTIRRGFSRQRMSAMIHPSGWLSNSYLNGLILPGEGLSHFLISTLLENDETALSTLGEEANLYGGFTYGRKSFWSTSCIVGRVLAAGKGATECVGWISSDVTPQGVGESWVNIEVDLATRSGSDKEARIWRKTVIERNGNIIGGADSSSVLPGDFVVPTDESSQQPLSIKLESLDLFAAAYSSKTTTPMNDTPTPLSDSTGSPGIQTFSAMMRFSVDDVKEEKREVNLALSSDVFFVTAFPCVSSGHNDVLITPTSPSFRMSLGNQTGPTGTMTSHPLHKSFTFTKISLSAVLSMPANIPFASLLSPPQSPFNERPQSTMHTTNSSIPKILILDCTDSTSNAFPTRPSLHPSSGLNNQMFGNDTEVLARALCAERGWNALISRRNRGCLSCSVREASALGWRVILRFG